MHIIAQYIDLDATMMADFREAGMQSSHKKSRGKTSVQLTPNDEGIYDFSNLPADPEIMLCLSESGFGVTDLRKSRGIVVGGIYGDPVVPHFILPPKSATPHNHAIFYLHDGGLRFRARGDGKASIDECTLQIEGSYARIEVKHLWEGRVGRLPLHLECYSQAIWAAWEKSTCYHCFRPHYIKRYENFLCPNASIISNRLHTAEF